MFGSYWIFLKIFSVFLSFCNLKVSSERKSVWIQRHVNNFGPFQVPFSMFLTFMTYLELLFKIFCSLLLFSGYLWVLEPVWILNKFSNVGHFKAIKTLSSIASVLILNGFSHNFSWMGCFRLFFFEIFGPFTGHFGFFNNFWAILFFVYLAIFMDLGHGSHFWSLWNAKACWERSSVWSPVHVNSFGQFSAMFSSFFTCVFGWFLELIEPFLVISGHIRFVKSVSRFGVFLSFCNIKVSLVWILPILDHFGH